MKRLFALLAGPVLAASVWAVAAPPAGAAATGSTTCTSNDLAGKTISTNVNVPAGARCDLSWSDVKGNVSVQGTLVTFGATHFEKNVSVTGGSFAAANWGVTIDGNLSFVNPAVYSYNGFWGDYSPNVVKGNLSYNIDSTTVYPCYQSPLLYFGGPTTVNNFNYSDLGTGFAGHLDQGGLTVLGSKTILMGTGSC
jgi:hypothetical protein